MRRLTATGLSRSGSLVSARARTRAPGAARAPVMIAACTPACTCPFRVSRQTCPAHRAAAPAEASSLGIPSR